jgi:hypothetical protein
LICHIIICSAEIQPNFEKRINDKVRTHVMAYSKSIVKAFSKLSQTHRRNRAASAPSIIRWSYESDNGSILRDWNSPFTYLGSIEARLIPRMATRGHKTMGVNATPPMPP